MLDANPRIFSGQASDVERFSIGYIEYCVLFPMRAHSRDKDAPLCHVKRDAMAIYLKQTETVGWALQGE
jgi:hypothetical protein